MGVSGARISLMAAGAFLALAARLGSAKARDDALGGVGSRFRGNDVGRGGQGRRGCAPSAVLSRRLDSCLRRNDDALRASSRSTLTRRHRRRPLPL